MRLSLRFIIPQDERLYALAFCDPHGALVYKTESPSKSDKLPAVACRNRHGLLSEHIDIRTRELWGNFPQTYSMVGLINCAQRLSIPWEHAY